MLRLIKSLFKDNLFIIAIGITIFIGYLSLMKMPKVDIDFTTNVDKLYHLFAYFTLTICWLFSFYKKKQKHLKYYIVLGCVIYGIVIEVLQSKLTDYRTGDYMDILANSLGILLALIVFNQILKKIKVNSL